MARIQGRTTCPCGSYLHVVIDKPKAFAQRSLTIDCGVCRSKFMATVKRKGSQGTVVFEILDLTEKACEALRQKQPVEKPVSSTIGEQGLAGIPLREIIEGIERRRGGG